MSNNEIAKKLIKTLKSLKIDASIQDVFPGPVITIYDIILTPGTKIQKVKENLDKISLAMETAVIRIEKIPQEATIRIEIPNQSTL